MAITGIKNIGLFGHNSSGKTTIADAFLYLAGANTRFGKASDKTSVFDSEPEEIERGCSISLGLATFNFKDFNINLIDTPGYSDFIGEAISGVEAVEYLKEHTADLILLDMIMDPGINGRETYERIIKINPTQKAIIVSGFAETDEVKETQKLGAGRYIKKPVTLEKLGLAVKEELER